MPQTTYAFAKLHATIPFSVVVLRIRMVKRENKDVTFQVSLAAFRPRKLREGVE